MERNSKKRKGVVSKIFKFVFFTLSIIILLIAGTIMIKANIHPEQVPDVLGYYLDLWKLLYIQEI